MAAEKLYKAQASACRWFAVSCRGESRQSARAMHAAQHDAAMARVVSSRSVAARRDAGVGRDRLFSGQLFSRQLLRVIGTVPRDATRYQPPSPPLITPATALRFPAASCTQTSAHASLSSRRLGDATGLWSLIKRAPKASVKRKVFEVRCCQ